MSGVGLFAGEQPFYQHAAFKGRRLLESNGQDMEPVVDVHVSGRGRLKES